MKYKIGLSTILFASHLTWAQAVAKPPPAQETPIEKAKENAKEVVEKVKDIANESQPRRAETNFFILGNYSPFDLILPSKLGATMGFVKHANKTYEFEYLKGSVPFLIDHMGSMDDTRYSLIVRSYYGGSFNFSYGLTYFDFGMRIGDEMMNRVTGGNYPNIEFIDLESIGFNLAIGNRWVIKHNITLGVDWISWAQPVIITKKEDAFLDYATNPEDRDDINTALNVISYFPRLAFLKFQIGMSF